MDTAADRNPEDTSKPEILFQFWSLLRSEYPDYANHSVLQQLPFVSKYNCEAAFLKYVLTKTKTKMETPSRRKYAGAVIQYLKLLQTKQTMYV
jgi:hypothetical protein